jgi:hypothetical protein
MPDKRSCLTNPLAAFAAKGPAKNFLFVQLQINPLEALPLQLKAEQHEDAPNHFPI